MNIQQAINILEYHQKFRLEKVNIPQKKEAITDALQSVLDTFNGGKMYVVKYSTGSWEDYVVKNVFVTFDKDVAERYVAKFEATLQKLKSYYCQFTDIHNQDENYYIKWNRSVDLQEINRCWYEEIQLR